MGLRVKWADLPNEVVAAVRSAVGPVLDAEDISAGASCPVRVRLLTSRHGTLMVKGSRFGDATSMAWEEELAPTVAPRVGPHLLAAIRVHAWYLLVFKWVGGRHADLSPQSDDLGAVGMLFQRMQNLREPPDCLLRPFARRFPMSLSDARLLKGRAVLHMNPDPQNIVMDDSGRAFMVDWATPAFGLAWIDPALMAVRLMECGHSPSSVSFWLARFWSWVTATTPEVSAFIRVMSRHLRDSLGEGAAEPHVARFAHLGRFPRVLARRSLADIYSGSIFLGEGL